MCPFNEQGACVILSPFGPKAHVTSPVCKPSAGDRVVAHGPSGTHNYNSALWRGSAKFLWQESSEHPSQGFGWDGRASPKRHRKVSVL